MEKKNLTLIFTIKNFEVSYLYKDVGLVPYYLSKQYNLNGNIIYSNKNKKELPKEFREILLTELPYNKIWKIIEKIDKFSIIENIKFYKYLFKKAKEIDYLMFFHLGIDKFFLMVLYKLLNKNGKIYLKLDADLRTILMINNKKSSFTKKILKKIFFNKFFGMINLISIEGLETYNEILKNGLYNKNISSKIINIPNGFDEDYLIENNIKIKVFEEKENIMITVGRIGTTQKNNEMLLEALNNTDLKNWKIYIIGPYTKEFKTKYNEFIKGNQDKKESVILVGNIEDKNLLYDYYNRAKVFLLTSRWEGFAIVYPEALRFGNYIITTNVGGAQDITDNNKVGTVTEIENTYQFSDEILKVVNNEIDLKEKYYESLKLSKRQFLWNEIVKNKKCKSFFEGK